MHGHYSRRLAVVAALAALIVPALGDTHAAVAAPGPREAANARLLVTFAPGASAGAQDALHRAAGASVRTIASSLRTVAVDVDGAEVDDALRAYRSAPNVEWAGVETEYRAMALPDDNGVRLQWNLVEGARGSTRWGAVYEENFGAGVIVAVIDTGVGRPPGEDAYDGFEHPLVLHPGADFVAPGTDPYDENGHGTFVAGTIAQQTGNADTAEPRTPELSLAGIAPDAQIMPVRVLTGRGAGSPLHAALGIQFATDRGARVINLSLGGGYVKPVCDAVAYAVQRGVIVVAASGNESSAGIVPATYPAACPGAIAVGGHRFDGARAGYSNASCELAISAPGGDLSSGRVFPGDDVRNVILQEAWRSDTGYAFFPDAGTSMATAHVAGAAAILLGAGFNETAAEATRILRATTRDAGPVTGPDRESGAGALDIAAAVEASRSGLVPQLRESLGYWMVASDGGIFAFGDAPFLGSTGNLKLNSPIVAMARTASGRGYWMVAADGGIFTFGDAPFYGSAATTPLASPIVGITAYPDGTGYWLVARDGGIFSYSAPGAQNRFYGSTGGVRLNSPIIGMATNRTGGGYWLFAADGGVFVFTASNPDADRPIFHGSAGGLRLNAPIVAGVPTPTGHGYWLVATDGGIFAYGDAGYFGSTGDIKLNQPIVGMAPTCYGRGYWLVARDGGIFGFGGASFLGSTGHIRLNQPIVGMTIAVDQRAAPQ